MKDIVGARHAVPKMVLNDAGGVAVQCWQTIPDHFPHVELDVFVIMPNHLYGIIVLHDNFWARPVCRQAGMPCPYNKPVLDSMPTIKLTAKIRARHAVPLQLVIANAWRAQT